MCGVSGFFITVKCESHEVRLVVGCEAILADQYLLVHSKAVVLEELNCPLDDPLLLLLHPVRVDELLLHLVLLDQRRHHLHFLLPVLKVHCLDKVPCNSGASAQPLLGCIHRVGGCKVLSGQVSSSSAIPLQIPLQQTHFSLSRSRTSGETSAVS